MTSRLARTSTKLSIGSYSSNDVPGSTATLGDFNLPHMGATESCAFTNGKFGERKTEPTTFAVSKENVQNQITSIRDVYGPHHVGERERAPEFLRN